MRERMQQSALFVSRETWVISTTQTNAMFHVKHNTPDNPSEKTERKIYAFFVF